MTVVTATDLSFRVGRKALIDGVSFSVDPGRVVALVGPNGAGKSTLLRTLSGELTPSAGTVRLNGEAPHRLRPHELALHRAVLSQHITVTFPFTVSEIVQMGAGESGARNAIDLADQALAEVDLDGFQQRTIGTLSGGEQQRVHFARTLVQLAVGEKARGPGILLLDEPTASLDLRHQLDLIAAIRRRAQRGTTVIIVLHDLNLAAVLADCVVLLEHGRVAAEGRPETVINDEIFSRIFGVTRAVSEMPSKGIPFVLPHSARVL